jgi:ADP-ribosyl-[dinitrogen reductase] hydrolase
MRCAPVALRWRTDAQRLVEESRRSALVTHYDPRCVWSVVAFNAALARSLSGLPLDLARLAEALAAAGAPQEVVLGVHHAPRSSLAGLDLDNPQDQGYTIKAMRVGLWVLHKGPDFEGALTAIVNAGGDTDTNGAVAGAALGSRVGLTGIPQRWLQRVRSLDYLLALADRLLAAAVSEAAP